MAWALASLNQNIQIFVPRSLFIHLWRKLLQPLHTGRWNGRPPTIQDMTHHAGKIVKKHFDSLPRSFSVAWLARQLHCDRTNIYHIFQRQSIDSLTLARLSIILGHNFFSDLAEEIEPVLTDPAKHFNREDCQKVEEETLNSTLHTP